MTECFEGSFTSSDVGSDVDAAFCFGDFDFPFDCKNCSRLGSVKFRFKQNEVNKNQPYQIVCYLNTILLLIAKCPCIGK